MQLGITGQLLAGTHLHHVQVCHHNPLSSIGHPMSTVDNYDCPMDCHLSYHSPRVHLTWTDTPCPYTVDGRELPCVPPYMHGLSHVSAGRPVPLFHMGRDGLPLCPSHPTVPHGVPIMHGLSHVSVPSHCPTRDGKDCPRYSSVSHCTWRPSHPTVPHGTGGTVLRTPVCPKQNNSSLDCYAPI